LQGNGGLLCKEGIALSALTDQHFKGRRGVVGSEGVADERVCVLVGKWLYGQLMEIRVIGPGVAKSGPGGAE